MCTTCTMVVEEQVLLSDASDATDGILKKFEDLGMRNDF